MNIKEWLENRKAKKEAKRSAYDVIEEKLKDELKGTTDYDERAKIRRELAETFTLRDKERDSKSRYTKQDRGGIVIKVLGLIGGAFGLGSIIFAEHKGMVFTGEKRTIMDSISRAIGNVLTGFRKG